MRTPNHPPQILGDTEKALASSHAKSSQEHAVLPLTGQALAHGSETVQRLRSDLDACFRTLHRCMDCISVFARNNRSVSQELMLEQCNQLAKEKALVYVYILPTTNANGVSLSFSPQFTLQSGQTNRFSDRLVYTQGRHGGSDSAAA